MTESLPSIQKGGPDFISQQPMSQPGVVVPTCSPGGSEYQVMLTLGYLANAGTA